MTQNDTGEQFDVYFRFSDADPYATSIQCPLGQTTGCFSTADESPAELSDEYQLLPGVLQAYTVSQTDLGDYIRPYSRGKDKDDDDGDDHHDGPEHGKSGRH